MKLDDKKLARAEKLEARARRARADAIAVTDENVRRALRIHDLATDLSLALDEADDGGATARVILDASEKLLSALGAPL